MHDKLRHLPHILYTNVKSQTNRKHWMEYHFRVYGMAFTRIEQPPASELPKDFHKQLDGDYEESSLMINWYSSQILNFFVD